MKRKNQNYNNSLKEFLWEKLKSSQSKRNNVCYVNTLINSEDKILEWCWKTKPGQLHPHWQWLQENLNKYRNANGMTSMTLKTTGTTTWLSDSELNVENYCNVYIYTWLNVERVDVHPLNLQSALICLKLLCLTSWSTEDMISDILFEPLSKFLGCSQLDCSTHFSLLDIYADHMMSTLLDCSYCAYPNQKCSHIYCVCFMPYCWPSQTLEF